MKNLIWLTVGNYLFLEILFVFNLLVPCPVHAAELPIHADSHELAASTQEHDPRIEIFVREGCFYCQKAKEFLDKLHQEYPSLVVIECDISRDPAALKEFRSIIQSMPLDQAGVPTFRINGKIIVGFAGEDSTGREIRTLIAQTSLPEHARPINIPLLGKVSPADLGFPIFTIVMGLMDGFNPCAMWVLLFLLSLLIHLKSRKKMFIIAATFVIISGAVYFVFMAAWLNFFFILGVARWIQLALGGIAILIGSINAKDFFAFKKGLSLSIPESAKPKITQLVRKILQAENIFAALASVSLLAIMVNIVELLCTAGLPAIYTQVLSAQNLSTPAYYGYLLLYNLAYIIDDSIMVFIAIITLTQIRLQEQAGRILKLVSGLVMIALGLLLIFRPNWII